MTHKFFEPFKWISDSMERDCAELEIWRKFYPHRAIYIAEEARAKVEGCEPDYPRPIAIG